MARRMSADTFVNTVCEAYKSHGQKFCFIIGSGTSVTSGIPSGKKLAEKWFKEIKDSCRNDEAFKNSLKERIDEIVLKSNGEKTKAQYNKYLKKTYMPTNEDYFDIYDLRFCFDEKAGAVEIINLMTGKIPGFGYYALSTILTNTKNDFVITTNFDDLVEEAIRIYTAKHPLVIGHESLAFILKDHVPDRPVIAKVHRDLFYKPLSSKSEMDSLKREWEEPLTEMLRNYIPIVIGYAGTDHSLMRLLGELELDRIYWCHMPWEDVTKNPRIKAIIEKSNGYAVEINGFDEIMFAIAEKFHYENIVEFNNPIAGLRDNTNKQLIRFLNTYSAMRENIKSGGIIEEYENRQLEMLNDPREDYEFYFLGNLYSDRKEYDKAVKYYDKTIKRNKWAIEAYYNRGNALAGFGEHKEAIQDYTKAIELDPNNTAAYINRGTTFDKLGKYEKAIADYTKAIELDPDDAEAYNNRGYVLYKLGKYDDVMEDCNKAIELDPNLAEAYDSRGVVWLKMDNPKEAIADFDKALNLNPELAETYYNRACAWRALCDNEKAEQDLAKARFLGYDC